MYYLCVAYGEQRVTVIGSLLMGFTIFYFVPNGVRQHTMWLTYKFYAKVGLFIFFFFKFNYWVLIGYSYLKGNRRNWCLPVKRRFSGYCDAKSFLNVTRIGLLVNPFSLGTTELLYQMGAKASKYTFDVYSEKKLLLAFTFENWNWHFLGVLK